MILEDGIFRSELFADLPVLHGFTIRQWGNLGFGKKPKDPDVIANRRKLFSALGVADRIHVQPRQLHTDRCMDAATFHPGDEADATFSNSNQHLLSVLTADCVSILLYHPDGICAAIHAGWRGLYHEIIPKTLIQLPKHPLAVVGPAIGACCYEVGPDLASDFEKKFGAEVVQAVSDGKPHLDLVRTAMLQLMASGVEKMEVSHLCTSCHPDLFFSYRRDGSSGRMMSYIGLL